MNEPITPPHPTPMYRYGIMAWFWRLLITAALVFGGLLFWIGAQKFELVLMLMGAIILTPALIFGSIVVVAIDDNMDGTLSFSALLPWRRRAQRTSIGRPRLRKHYQGDVHRMHAPAIWVRIGGWLPIYIDLLGDTVGTTFRRRRREVFPIAIQAFPT